MNSKLLKLARMVLKLAEVETDKGVLISDGALEVGVEAFVENAEGELVAAEDGEYKADDDKVYVIVDGKVAEIREPEPEQAPAEQPVEENQEEQEPEGETEDDKDKRIAELEAQIEELNNVIVEKDNLIGELRDKLEGKESENEELKTQLSATDAKSAEELLKSQEQEKKENKWTYKPRY